MVNASLSPKGTGTTVWHINADEPNDGLGDGDTPDDIGTNTVLFYRP